MMLKNFECLVFRAFSSWEKRYRKAVVKQDFMSLHHWTYVDPDLPANKKKEIMEYALTCLEFQIQFIKILVSFMTLSGKTKENFSRIKRFLSYQMPSFEYGFKITFFGGCYPEPVSVKVRNLGEFDFADAWSELRFQNICISPRQQHISHKDKKRIEMQLCRYFTDDLRSGGHHQAKIKVTAGNTASQEINFKCSVK
jgi:hypothetical protein